MTTRHLEGCSVAWVLKSKGGSVIREDENNSIFTLDIKLSQMFCDTNNKGRKRIRKQKEVVTVLISSLPRIDIIDLTQ